MADDTERLLLETQAATDQANAAFADLADTIDAIPDPDVVATADTTAAADELGGLAEDAKKVDATKVTVTATADTTSATEQLSRFGATATSSGGEAGKKFGAQFVGDVGGALGDAAAPVVNGFAQALETGLASAGVEEAIAGPIVAAFGVASVAFLAVKTFWSAFTSGADEAKKAVEQVTSVQQDLAKGELDAASTKLLDTYKQLFADSKNYGLSVYDVTRYISGQTSAVDGWISSAQRQADQLKTLTPGQRAQGEQIQGVIDKLKAAQGAWGTSSDAIAANKQNVDDLNRALGSVADTSATVNIYVNDSELEDALNQIRQIQRTGVSFFGAATASGVAASAVSKAQAAQATAAATRDYQRRNGAVALN
jgi:hypothetical protein